MIVVEAVSGRHEGDCLEVFCALKIERRSPAQPLRREEKLSKDSLLPVFDSRFVSNGVGVTGALDMSKAERAQVHASDHQIV